MSIPVDLGDLERTLAGFGPGYLLTVSADAADAADAAVKVVTVRPALRDGALLVTGPGRGTLANLAANPRVTLAFPPREEHGHTLLVDGTGSVEGADVRVVPFAAVLHRPAADAAAAGDPPSSAGGCGHDCRPVT